MIEYFVKTYTREGETILYYFDNIEDTIKQYRDDKSKGYICHAYMGTVLDIPDEDSTED